MSQQNTTENRKKFGDVLRACRIRRGLSREELAVAVGLKGESAVGNWETGLNGPTKARIARIAQVLGVSVDFLLNGPGFPGPAEESISTFVLESFEPADFKREIQRALDAGRFGVARQLIELMEKRESESKNKAASAAKKN